MFSVNNFYNYLNQYLINNKKDVDMKSFNVHGSRLLKDISKPSFDVVVAPQRLIGQAAMFDQEPIQLDYFTDWIDFDPSTSPEGYEYNATGNLYKNLSPEEFIFRHFSAVSNPILCHSERNSPEVALFKQNHFHPVHYFYHGLISRDWFRHWKHYNMDRSTESRRLGMYARDASGSRAYRLDLLNGLIPYRGHLHFELQGPIINFDPELETWYELSRTEYSSDASATIVPEDCLKFDIQIVPETLFNTQKTHLTEKVFKPIVMKQPFIIAGCPNSLEYLKSYGFRTFDGLWDESYDKETDAEKRMEMILDVVKHITELDDASYTRLLDRAQSIIDFNHNHFFSNEFENEMLLELHNNLNTAVAERNEEFKTMPGGTYFMYLDQLSKAGHNITDYNRVRATALVKHLLLSHPAVGREVMIKYKHLLD